MTKRTLSIGIWLLAGTFLMAPMIVAEVDFEKENADYLAWVTTQGAPEEQQSKIKGYYDVLNVTAPMEQICNRSVYSKLPSYDQATYDSLTAAGSKLEDSNKFAYLKGQETGKLLRDIINNKQLPQYLKDDAIKRVEAIRAKTETFEGTEVMSWGFAGVKLGLQDLNIAWPW